MKKIKLRKDDNEQLTTVGIIKLVAGNSPNKPLGVDEMRRRVRILDVIEAVESTTADHVFLEDEDAKALNVAIEGFPWSTANKQLLAIIDDVLKAESHSPVKLVETK